MTASKAKLAIMQPYLFPYVGYWQLILAVDKFLIYDDVNYIRGGWINRNRILVNDNPIYLTIPVSQASSFKKISEIKINEQIHWKRKFLNAIALAYGKTPFFNEIYPFLQICINDFDKNLSTSIINQIKSICFLLDIRTEILIASNENIATDKSGTNRIIEICKHFDAGQYFNLPGGVDLYTPDVFSKFNVDLKFIIPKSEPYTQKSKIFYPNLSIIDLLMNLGPQGTKDYLCNNLETS